MTPTATKVALVGTLGATVAALVAFAVSAPTRDVDPRFAGWFLLLFSLLFLARVAGQVLVVLARPRWLPPAGDWNLLPYPLLLPLQLVLLGLIGWLLHGFVSASGPASKPVPEFGAAVVAFSAVYAAAMVVRFAVRMRRRPEARWFGGAIPIVFHLVLAAFLFVYGTYHASY
jgi:hypothetical protein